MPVSSLILLYSGIFCLFAAIGVVTLMTESAPPGLWLSFAYVVYWGGTAAALAAAALRRKYVVVPLILVVNIIVAVLLNRVTGHSHPTVGLDPRLHSSLEIMGQAGIWTLAGAYAFFMFFFSREGTRYFRVHTEIELARELHHALVPAIQGRIGDFEIYGASIPSGEVGGDLVDLVVHDDQWTAYVADVSGHGLSPGVLMAMFKAIVHTHLLTDCRDGKLLENVHRALYPLKTSNMFVTAGFLQARDGRLWLSLAGHPPLLHYRPQSAEVNEHLPLDLPLGILPEQSFSTVEINCDPGDILLLLTDGLLEVPNRDGAELGVDPIKSQLLRCANLPLSEIFRSIRELTLLHGLQQDDQTMLLVRRAR